MVTGLEPSLCVRFYSQVRYPYNEFAHSIPSYFSKCIITTIRLSGLSQRTKTTFVPLASRLTTLVLSIHVILLFHPLCPTIDILQFCKYYKHVLQSWAWDHERHITTYDLSRQRRCSVILVYIPHEITVKYNYLHRPLYLGDKMLMNNEYQTTL